MVIFGRPNFRDELEHGDSENHISEVSFNFSSRGKELSLLTFSISKLTSVGVRSCHYKGVFQGVVDFRGKGWLTLGVRDGVCV